jgi:hypothetical protein
VGLPVQLPLGDARIPAHEIAAEMFALFRVPLLHGFLPAPGPIRELLAKCPGVTNDDLETPGVEALPGLAAGEFQALLGYTRAHQGGAFGAWNPPLCTPAGLQALAAALGPGGVGGLYGQGHFSTVFCHPTRTEAGGLDVFRLSACAAGAARPERRAARRPRAFFYPPRGTRPSHADYEVELPAGTPRAARVGWFRFSAEAGGRVEQQACDEEFEQHDTERGGCGGCPSCLAKKRAGLSKGQEELMAVIAAFSRAEREGRGGGAGGERLARQGPYLKPKTPTRTPTPAAPGEEGAVLAHAPELGGPAAARAADETQAADEARAEGAGGQPQAPKRE